MGMLIVETTRRILREARQGSFNQGAMTIQMGLDTVDTWQILLKSASISGAYHSFLVTTQNGDKYYF
jgi:hypothetical protein